ncbi:MAG: DciA family protein [Mizugakiibacter sp.]|uniref:DciA family protein n=1 Tax=Mizugakiibacter sp. TaxID=1972610 RepID=UPI0031C01ADE|nr:DUF721 domain-containing protein [Xanthomonadaceae bacterium]
MQPSSPSRRKRSGPVPVGECVSVAALAERARELDRMDQRLRQTLPVPLRDQVRFADVRNGRVVFLASSPAWASRLRLAQAQILSTARTLGVRAESVTVKVATLPSVPPEPAGRKPLSPAAARHLQAAAKSLTDPELRALFLELASFAELSSPHGR